MIQNHLSGGHILTKNIKDSKLHTDQALAACKDHELLKTAIVHPVKSKALIAAKDAFDEGLIDPVLVGPEDRIKSAADEASIDISQWDLIPTEHSHAAASISCEMAGKGEVEALMKGSLHSEEILGAVIRSKALRTERRISHVYAMEVETYHKPFLLTDAAINIVPDLKTKADIVQNAINLWHVLNDDGEIPKVALLAAVEMVKPDMQATIDAASLCKMADRGQIQGGLLDGPLAFDNAISREAAEHKGIKSDVAGDPDILVAPDLEAGNIMAKQMTFISEAQAAGIVLGARVPIILTSRADSLRTRLLSCALAVKLAVARREGKIK